MVLLSDMLQRQSKEEFIKAGSVYRVNLTKDEGIKPKNKGDISRNKYIVIAGKDNSNIIAYLLINSNINKNLPQNIQRLHYPLSKDRHNFLEHNSFVDCSRMKLININKFTEKNFIPIGKIDNDDFNLMKGSLKESDLIADHELIKYGIAD